MEHVHFIGIGGVGMSGLAQVVLRQGTRVSGSDPCTNEATERLAAAGVVLYRQQEAANIASERPGLVVVTAAVGESNPELRAARDAGIPVVTRAEYLGRLMAAHRGVRIGVTGTHGKTTTTSMLALVLVEAGVDPTVLIGGEFAPIGGNTRVGDGGVFLTEACEAYSSFLSLWPDIAVVTNVDADHLDHYGTFEGVQQAFVQFACQVAEGGALVWCSDDPGALDLVERRLGDRGPARRVAYGFAPRAGVSVWARGLESAATGSTFTLMRTSEDGDAALGSVRLRVLGRHSVLNSLAAAAVGLEMGIAPETIVSALQRFEGTGRRFEVLGEVEGVTVVDDYAHHPGEIAASVAAARTGYAGRRLIAVFQPHLFSRTRDFMDGFASALAGADTVLVADIYAARERPDPEVSSREVVRRIRLGWPDKTVLYVGPKGEVPEAVRCVARPGDVALFMGAGDIRDAAEAFVGGGDELGVTP